MLSDVPSLEELKQYGGEINPETGMIENVAPPDPYAPQQPTQYSTPAVPPPPQRSTPARPKFVPPGEPTEPLLHPGDPGWREPYWTEGEPRVIPGPVSLSPEEVQQFNVPPTTPPAVAGDDFWDAPTVGDGGEVATAPEAAPSRAPSHRTPSHRAPKAEPSPTGTMPSTPDDGMDEATVSATPIKGPEYTYQIKMMDAPEVAKMRNLPPGAAPWASLPEDMEAPPPRGAPYESLVPPPPAAATGLQQPVTTIEGPMGDIAQPGQSVPVGGKRTVTYTKPEDDPRKLPLTFDVTQKITGTDPQTGQPTLSEPAPVQIHKIDPQGRSFGDEPTVPMIPPKPENLSEQGYAAAGNEFVFQPAPKSPQPAPPVPEVPAAPLPEAPGMQTPHPFGLPFTPGPPQPLEQPPPQYGTTAPDPSPDAGDPGIAGPPPPPPPPPPKTGRLAAGKGLKAPEPALSPHKGRISTGARVETTKGKTVRSRGGGQYKIPKGAVGVVQADIFGDGSRFRVQIERGGVAEFNREELKKTAAVSDLLGEVEQIVQSGGRTGDIIVHLLRRNASKDDIAAVLDNAERIGII